MTDRTKESAILRIPVYYKWYKWTARWRDIKSKFEGGGGSECTEIPCPVQVHDPPSTSMCSPTQKFPESFLGFLDGVLLHRQDWLNHMVMLAFSSTPDPSGRWGRRDFSQDTPLALLMLSVSTHSGKYMKPALHTFISHKFCSKCFNCPRQFSTKPLLWGW